MCTMTSMAQQKFFNLTADEVKIDSLLPHFSYMLPLGKNYADSVYSVEIKYPEFMDMGTADINRTKIISETEWPALPTPQSKVVVERKKGLLKVSFVPLVFRDGKYKKMVSFMLDIKASPKHGSAGARRPIGISMAAGGNAPKRYAPHSILAQGRWAKIRIPESGVYQLSEALIRKAGFNNMEQVKIYGYGGALQNEILTEEDLIEHDDLKEVATCTIDGRRLFYAQGPVSWGSRTASVRTRNPYSDYGYYFITQSEGEPLSMERDSFVNSFYPSNDDFHSLHEVDNFSWYDGGRNLFENTPISEGNSKSYTIATPGLSTQGSLSIAISAGTNSSAQISVNGKEKGILSIKTEKYEKGGAQSAVYAIDDLAAENTVTVKTISGGPVHLDYISTCFDHPRPLPDLSSATNIPVPEYVYNITNQDLHADSAYQMVIIIPATQKTVAQAQRLKEMHEQHDGMKVRIVPADELYNEFSSGTPDANAYRRYLKMLYDKAQNESDMPSHLLLFGDCAWDNRMNTSAWKGENPDDYLLCFESENSFSEIKCYVDDGFFCYLDDGEGGDPLKTDCPDIAVGRFPVVTAEDAQTMVDKTINYVKNENAGAWQNTVMLMGDDGNANIHMTSADRTASLVEQLNPGMYVKRVMWDSFNRTSSSTGHSYPDVTRIIKQQQQSGALIMNYYGHGAPYMISHEAVLQLKDFKEFTNKNLPLWITASCDIMPFDGRAETIGEVSLLNKKGGAVAFFGTTRTVYANYNEDINMAYIRALFTKTNGQYPTIGEAQRIAKTYLTEKVDKTVNKLQYSLLGDPALRLHIPTLTAVVDSINGLDISASGMAALKAGTTATVKGHIERRAATDTGFNGIVTATVRDSKEKTVGKLNNTSSEDGAQTPIVYSDRTKVLFSGSDEVENGEFQFNFAVPMDIKYSDMAGLINIYAVNKEKTEMANGHCDRFIVGDTGMVGNDSIGPSIYCYLNSPDFSNGGNVNPTPQFVAQINDKDGLNTSGSGIGHNLELIIDGNATKTYILNDYFAFDFGSYTNGSVSFQIPELEPGKHKLLFRAWDVLNNSSTTELAFHVVKGLEPNCSNINVSKNPAHDNTTFIITHDRAGNELDVEIEVFDMNGSQLWKHREKGVPDSDNYTVDWDLTMNNGSKLHTGIYLYRVRIGSDGSSKSSKAKKLMIINKQ
ncbi:MAG: type IX secretion system sortase PorU [Prevotella sp.]|nr:type IX secretion system sortase PorU [Prevotella sp.]